MLVTYFVWNWLSSQGIYRNIVEDVLPNIFLLDKFYADRIKKKTKKTNKCKKKKRKPPSRFPGSSEANPAGDKENRALGEVTFLYASSTTGGTASQAWQWSRVVNSTSHESAHDKVKTNQSRRFYGIAVARIRFSFSSDCASPESFVLLPYVMPR